MAHLIILRRDAPPEARELTEAGLTIGRDPAQDVVLDEKKVSSAHARIELAEGHAHVVDEASKNGSFLNGTRLASGARERLRPGDELTIGTTLLRYVTHELPATALAEEVTKLFASDVRLMIEEILEETASRTGGSGSELARQLSVFYRLLKLDRPEDGIDRFAHRLAELARDAVGADRAIVMLSEPRSQGLVPRATAGVPPGASPEPLVDDATLVQVHRTQQARLEPSEGRAGSPSVDVLCVPVPGGESHPGGVLYLERRAAPPRLGATELRLLALMAVQAASILRTIVLYGSMEQQLERRTREVAERNDEIGALRAELASRYRFGEMYGASPRMQEVYALIERFAPTDYTVLVTGESGTGKEVLARTIHGASTRAERPFVAVNCGAIVAEILESELFGHARGSFTGATSDKRGFFRDAEGGTIFLDEITEMPPGAQVKLLRVLEERSVVPVGTTQPIPVDVRVIAASNQDLEDAVACGRLRQDLFFRLHVLEIPLPPLRERREDIPGLAARFVDAAATKLEREPPRLGDALLAALDRHDWPGNVRELKAALEYATTLSLGDELAPEHLPPRLRASLGETPPAVAAEADAPATSLTLEDIEREHILRVFEETGRQRTQTAELLGIGRRTLYRKLLAYGVVDEDAAEP